MLRFNRIAGHIVCDEVDDEGNVLGVRIVGESIVHRPQLTPSAIAEIDAAIDQVNAEETLQKKVEAEQAKPKRRKSPKRKGSKAAKRKR